MLHIRTALPSEASSLSAVAWSAKAHWGYPAEVLEGWRAELSPTEDSINSAPTLVAEFDGTIAGWCQLSLHSSPIELEHFWVHPGFMRRGVGRALISKVCEHLRLQGVTTLLIDADPNAEPFYVRCGAVRKGEIAAPIPGDPSRVRPLLELEVTVNPETSRTTRSGA